MVTPSGQHIRSAITQLAANWYVAQRNGSLSETERAEFLAWLKASPVHIEEYLGVAALDRVLAQNTAESPLSVADWARRARDDQSNRIVELTIPRAFKPEPTRNRSGRRFWLNIAAVVLLCAAGVGMYWGVHNWPSLDIPKSYQTAHGAQGTWRLSDGSTLRLDSDTAVKVRFTANGRSLAIDRGQIWVAVAHDVRRPFRVQAGLAEVVAVGTEFDVYRMRDSTLVTVIEGKVAVSLRNGATQYPLQVGADQEVRLSDGTLPVAPAPANRREATAWLDRKIVFDRRPLEEVADEFNRYNSIPITIDDPMLRRMAISGSFDASDVDSFVAFLQTLPGVGVKRRRASLSVVSRPANAREPTDASRPAGTATR